MKNKGWLIARDVKYSWAPEPDGSSLSKRKDALAVRLRKTELGRLLRAATAKAPHLIRFLGVLEPQQRFQEITREPNLALLYRSLPHVGKNGSKLHRPHIILHEKVEASDLISALNEKSIKLPLIGGDKFLKMLFGVFDAINSMHTFTILKASGEQVKKTLTHSDINLNNIWVLSSSGDIPYLSIGDYDLVESLEGDSVFSLLEKNVGTDLYASPEQRTRNFHSDEKSDIYSLGLTVHDILAYGIGGISEFIKAYKLREVTHTTFLEELKMMPKILESMPDEIKKVLEKATASEPKDRYESVLSFWNAFSVAYQKDYKLKITDMPEFYVNTVSEDEMI